MKRLILVRHAESGWARPFEKDFDRTLTDAGIMDAKQMAERLRLQNIFPEQIYSSPAKRAVGTANIFKSILIPEGDILIVDDALYGPSVKTFYDVIDRIPADVDSAMIFSHNRGITDFVNDLGCKPVIHMSPAAVFGVEADIMKWEDFRSAEKVFLFHRQPQRAR